eukprot:1880233-Rhodomonas_salina.1
MACAVIQNFAMYIGAISVLSEVKWMWFIITLAGLAGVLLHLSKVFKSAADAKGGAAAELFSTMLTVMVVVVQVTVYALLDVLNKVLLCFLILGGVDALDGGNEIGRRVRVGVLSLGQGGTPTRTEFALRNQPTRNHTLRRNRTGKGWDSRSQVKCAGRVWLGGCGWAPREWGLERESKQHCWMACACLSPAAQRFTSTHAERKHPLLAQTPSRLPLRACGST